MSKTRLHRHASLFSKTAPKPGLTTLPRITETTETVSDNAKKPNATATATSHPVTPPRPITSAESLIPERSLTPTKPVLPTIYITRRRRSSLVLPSDVLPEIFRKESTTIPATDKPYEAAVAILKIAIRSLSVLSTHFKNTMRTDNIVSSNCNRRRLETLSLKNIEELTEIFALPISNEKKLGLLITNAKQYFQNYPTTVQTLDKLNLTFSVPVKMHQVYKIIAALDINQIDHDTVKTLQQNLESASKFFVTASNNNSSPRKTM